MLLTQDQEMIRDAVRAFAQEELWPNAARWDKEHTSRKMCTSRAWQHSAPTASACPRNTAARNLDYLTLALVLEEIAAGDGGTSTAISVTNCPVNAILMRYGNEATEEAVADPAGAGRAARRLLSDRAARGQSTLRPCAPRR
jgi:alkylation response protein AidB-like acyl-CoA dehydrogenase